MTYANSVLDLIGDTPLVRLSSTVGETASLVLAKVEYRGNPGGLGEGPDRRTHGRGRRGER